MTETLLPDLQTEESRRAVAEAVMRTGPAGLRRVRRLLRGE